MDPITSTPYRHAYVCAWRKVMRAPRDGFITCQDLPAISVEFLRAKFMRELDQRISQRK